MTQQQHPIFAIIERYKLDPRDDKRGDWYKAHGIPCLTKRAIGKIEKAENIIHDHPSVQVTGPIAYVSGSASMPVGLGTDNPTEKRVVFEVGSCRMDGVRAAKDADGRIVYDTRGLPIEIPNRNPEWSFPVEMAFKRWRGRATLRLIAPGDVLYSEDEVAHLQPEPPAAAAPTAAPAPAAAAPSPAPAAAPSPAPAAAAPAPAPQGSAWRDEIALIAQVCNIPTGTRFGSGRFAPDLATVMLKHCGKFTAEDTGRMVTVNTSRDYYPTWEKLHEVKSGWAVSALEKLIAVRKCLEAGERVTLEWDEYDRDRRESDWLQYEMVTMADPGFAQRADPANVVATHPERPAANPNPPSDFGGGGLPDDVPF